MNAVCSVQPQASILGVVRSGRVRTSSSQKLMPAILPKLLKDDHTNVPSKQLTHIGSTAVMITSHEVGSARAEVRVQPSKRSSVMYAPPRRIPSCASKRVPLLHPNARVSVSTTGPRPEPVRNLMFLVRTLQFLSCYSSSLLQKPQS